jgi:Protein of unknown function (DUF4242)
MPDFLAETYAPRGAAGTATPRAADIALAAEQASRPDAQVRFLGAIVVPEEETCFWLYKAPSAGAVREAMTRAGLRPERITPAVPVRPPRARPHRSPGGGAPPAEPVRTGQAPVLATTTHHPSAAHSTEMPSPSRNWLTATAAPAGS